MGMRSMDISFHSSKARFLETGERGAEGGRLIASPPFTPRSRPTSNFLFLQPYLPCRILAIADCTPGRLAPALTPTPTPTLTSYSYSASSTLWKKEGRVGVGVGVGARNVTYQRSSGTLRPKRF